MSSRMPLVLETLIVLASMAACGSSSSPSSTPTPTPTSSTSGANDAACADSNSVILSNFAFNPNCIQVAANQNVLFTNRDSATHTVTSDTGAALTFDSGNLDTNQTFQQNFGASAATVTGHCTIHPGMTFKVIVKP